MPRPTDLLYTKEHEWMKLDNGIATIGITDYAQEALGDIVFVELPKIGAKLEQFANAGVVESVKAVSDLFTPIAGDIVETNSAIEKDPALVNREPFGGGWLFKVKVSDPAQKAKLLDAATYDDLVKES